MMGFLGFYMEFANYVVITALVVAACAVLCCRDYVAAVVTLNVFSLLSALEYAILGAPDVSITEAAINACLGCVLLLCAGYLVKFDMGGDTRGKLSWLSLLCFFSAFVAVCVFASSLPLFGLETNPIVSMGSIYSKITAGVMRFPNVVTAILASFRGFDTLWETVVVFCAAVSVFSIIRRVR